MMPTPRHLFSATRIQTVACICLLLITCTSMSCSSLIAGGGLHYRWKLRMKEKSIQPLCDSLQQLAIRQHICAFSLDTISLTDTALQAKARKFGRYVEWNAKDSVLTLAAEGLLWNSGLQYDYSASGDKLSRQDKIKFRLKRVKGRLWFMRYYTEIPLM